MAAEQGLYCQAILGEVRDPLYDPGHHISVGSLWSEVAIELRPASRSLCQATPAFPPSFFRAKSYPPERR